MRIVQLLWTRRLRAVGLAFLLSAGSAAGEPLRDPASGLTVDPPPGYTAAAMNPAGRNAARFEVKRPEDVDTGCQVTFMLAPQNAGLTQEEIDATIGEPAWIDVARRSISPLYEVLDAAPFEHPAMRGLLMVADIKPQPAFPPRSQEIRTLFVILETPKGRSTVVCVGEKAGFLERRSEFEAVARAVTPPA